MYPRRTELQIDSIPATPGFPKWPDCPVCQICNLGVPARLGDPKAGGPLKWEGVAMHLQWPPFNLAKHIAMQDLL